MTSLYLYSILPSFTFLTCYIDRMAVDECGKNVMNILLHSQFHKYCELQMNMSSALHLQQLNVKSPAYLCVAMLTLAFLVLCQNEHNK